MKSEEESPPKTYGLLAEPGLINPLNAELNPIRHLLALVGARHIVHVSRIRVKCDKNIDCTIHKCSDMVHNKLPSKYSVLFTIMHRGIICLPLDPSRTV